jgi:hypothetical protein
LSELRIFFYKANLQVQVNGERCRVELTRYPIKMFARNTCFVLRRLEKTKGNILEENIQVPKFWANFVSNESGFKFFELRRNWNEFKQVENFFLSNFNGSKHILKV